ncbi:MAG: substrate-binding domain-containing protein, partial [Comamonas sp.]
MPKIASLHLRRHFFISLQALILSAGAVFSSHAQENFMVMASTTSTEQSGLFKHLLPAFTQATGIEVRVVAVGTGQALDMARRGDADILFVHDQVAEEKFVAEGFGLERRPVMYNDFVLLGPKSDPAGVRGNQIASALKKLATISQGFVSRGDKSGTHAAELRQWKMAGVDMSGPTPQGYKECGCGMGSALNIAASTNAYVLSDRGTWLNFKNRGDLDILV